MASSKAIGFLNFKFGADLGGFDRAMKKAQKNLKKFGKSVEKTGKKLTSSLTLPILAVGAGATKVFMDFEQAMLKVEAVSGATAEQMEMLSETAKRLGATTMFSASQVAELQLNLSKLGLTPVEIDKATESILRLSQATGEDLGETATVVASTMRAFGLTAGDTQRITDVMADSFSSTALDLDKFSTAMATLAPVAKESGVQIEQASALVGVLANNGVDASTAGTALRNIFLDLASEGMTLDEALYSINNSTDPLVTAFDMFGKRGATVATILSKNQDEISKLTEDFIDSEGEAASMADTMDKGLAGAMRKLKSQTEAAGIELGEVLAPIVNKLAGFIGSLMDKFSGLSDTTKKNIVIAAGLVAAIGPILILVGKLSVGLAAASKAFAALNLIMKANPIGVVITVIAALIGYLVYLYNTNQNVRASIKGLFAAAKVYFKGIADLAMNYFGGLGKLIIGVFTFDVDKIVEGFNQSKDAIIDYGKNMGKAFSDAYNEEMSKNVGEDMPEKLTTDFSNISTNNPYKEITEDTNEATEATKQYSEALNVIETDFLFQQSAVEDRFKNIIEWTKKLTQEQQIAQSGFQMFGDILTSSLDDALSSQEKFFPIFIANIKKAIQSLLVQLAVMTLISAIMPASLGGAGKAAFSSKNIMGNLGSIMGFADGGLVTGPTTALIGEGIGTTASNPEVVAPLDKLKQFMGGGSQNVVVEGVIKGNDIFLSNRNTGYNRQRSV